MIAKCLQIVDKLIHVLTDKTARDTQKKYKKSIVIQTFIAQLVVSSMAKQNRKDLPLVHNETADRGYKLNIHVDI